MNRQSPHLSALAVITMATILTSCTTIANRRDLYFPQTVWGPYTRMLHRGIPKPTPDHFKLESSSDGKSVIKPQN